MKYIVVPQPITLVNTLTKEPMKYAAGHPFEGQAVEVTAQRFLADNILNNQEIGKGMEAVRRVVKLEAAFKDAQPGDLVGVEDADYGAVLKVLSEATFSSPLHAAQLVSFFDSWENGAKQDDEWKRKQSLKSVSESA